MAHSHTPDGIPVIDLSLPDWDERYADGKREFGFVVAVNHGIPVTLLSQARDATERVFSLPEELLMEKYFHGVREKTRMRSGYFPYGSEKAKDHEGGWDLKRFWQIFRYGCAVPTYFPDEVPEYEPVMMGLFARLDELSRRLLSALTRHSGIPTAMPFEDMIVDGESMLRDIYYPALDDPPDDALRSTPHEDINLITLLVAATRAGLRLKTKSGEWIPVENPPDAIIVNTGDMLQMISFGDYPSMTHEVRNEGMDGVRIAKPYFTHPRPDVPLIRCKDWHRRCATRGYGSIDGKVVDALIDLGVPEKLQRLSDPNAPLVTAGEYLQHRLAEIHPDV